jgi:hypothetical protein
MDLSRNLILGRDAKPLNVDLPLKILYIHSRPMGFDDLGQEERTNLNDILKDKNLFDLYTLSVDGEGKATYSHVIDARQNYQFHVVHFDGHGQFARKCPECKRFHWAHHNVCTNPKCKTPLSVPIGFLLFETQEGNREWVGADDLFYLLDQSSTRLVVLSACESGTIRGESAYSSIAAQLLAKNIPCIVANQFPIRTDHAALFSATFYQELAKTGNVHKAMHRGRQVLQRTNSWYVPIIYSRHNYAPKFDEKPQLRGQLFTPIKKSAKTAEVAEYA